MSGLEVVTIATTDELAAVADEWDTLVDALPRPTPFLLHAWLAAWLRHYGEGARFEFHLARREGRLVGGLPILVRRRVARFPGGEHAQLAAIPAESAELAAALLEHVDGVDLVHLSGLPAGTPGGLRLLERVEAPVIDLSPGWDEWYAAHLSAKRRSQHRKRLRDLEAAGGATVRVESSEQALAEALRLHGLRWNGRGDRSSYALPCAAAFQRDLLTALGPRARIALLEVGGRAVAFRYGIRVGESLVGNGIGFDPAYARFSPGWVLLLAALEHAAGEGVCHVELLGGDEPYKLRFARPEPLHDGLAARTPLGRAALELRVATVRARRRLKRYETMRRLYALPRRRTAEA
jgi:CelD/BcsL family acetyltransferase involved in cellulose biosynthesis